MERSADEGVVTAIQLNNSRFSWKNSSIPRES